jgi:hypothetical protein
MKIKYESYFLLFLLVLLSGGCNSKNRKNEEGKVHGENYFILKGSFKNMGEQPLFFEKFTSGSFVSVDTLLPSDENKIISVLPVNRNAFCALKNISGDYIILYPSACDTILLEGDYNDFSRYAISGNRESEAIAELHKTSQVFIKNISSVARMTTDSIRSGNYTHLKQKLAKHYDSLFQDFRSYSLDFINENLESPVSLLALQNQIGRDMYVFDLRHDFDIYARVDSVLYSLYPDFPAIKDLHDRLNVIRIQLSSRGN